MGNCLVTKLKESVQNENLPFFNKLVINVTAGGDILFYRLGGNGVKITIENGYLLDYGKSQQWSELEFDGSAAYYLHMNNNGKMIIENYYNLTHFIVNDISITNSRFSSLDLSKLAYNSSIVSLKAALSGNIDNIVNNLSLNQLETTSSAVSGDYVNLAKKYVEKGRSTGSIDMIGLSYITFNNSHMPDQLLNSIGILGWESSTKVYFKTQSYVACTGYTDEEIAANIASGGIWEGISASNVIKM